MKKDNKFLNVFIWFLIYAAFVCLISLFAYCLYLIVRFSIFNDGEITKLEAVTLTVSILASIASTFVGGVAIYISVIQIKNNRAMNELLMKQNKDVFESQYKPLVVIEPKAFLYRTDKSALANYNIGFNKESKLIIQNWNFPYADEEDFRKPKTKNKYISFELLNPTKACAYNFYIGLVINDQKVFSPVPIVIGENQHLYLTLILDKDDIQVNDDAYLLITYQDVLSYVYKQTFKIKRKDNDIAIETSAIRETIKDQNDLFE